MTTPELLKHLDEVLAEEEPKLNSLKLILPNLAEVIPINNKENV